MKWIKPFWAVWGLLLMMGISSRIYASEAIDINSKAAAQLDSSFLWLDDPTGSLGHFDVIKAQQEGRLKPLAQLNRGYTSATSWLVVNFENKLDRPQHQWLWLYPFNLDQLDVFVQTGPNPDNPFSYVSYSLGDRQPMALKPLKQPQNILPLYFVDREVKRLFIRVHTSSPHFLRASMQAEPKLIEVMFRHTVIQTAYLSVAIGVTLLSWLFGWRLRDSVYGWYGAYVFTMALGYLSFEGMIGVLWPTGAHWVADHLQALGAGLGLSALVMFSGAYLAAPKQSPGLHRLFQALALAGVVLFVLAGTRAYVEWAWPLALSGLLLAALVLPLAWRNDRKRSLGSDPVMAWAFFALIANWALISLRGLGWLPVNDWTLNLVQAMGLIHMTLAAIGLSGRVLASERRVQTDALQRARQLANEMTLELQGRTAQLELALANEQVAAEQQRHFVDLVTHEYRTPLAVLRTNLDILQLEGPETHPVTQRRLDILRRSVERLSTVFEDRLAQAAWQAGGVRVTDIEAMELRKFLFRAIDHRKQEYSSLGKHQPDVLLEEGPMAWIQVNPGILSTVITNLFDNATKYAVGISPITLRLGNEVNKVRLSIKNACAAGLAADPSPYLQRGGRGINANMQAGQGLGLHIVHRLVREMGGELSLHIDPQGWFEARITWPEYQVGNPHE